MNLDFHPEAEEEFNAAIDYYESRERGLGNDFALEVLETISNILASPEAWPRIEGEVHRCITRRYPDGILYSIEASGIYVLAVMHLHREPWYWKHRSGG